MDARRGGGRSSSRSRAPAPGVEFDGCALSLTGGALRTLRSASYAAVAEVRLAHVAWHPHVSSGPGPPWSPALPAPPCRTLHLTPPPRQVLAALPALEALPRLRGLALHHNRIATLPALDPLLRLRRLRALEVTGSPVNACVLLRPYVAYRRALPWGLEATLRLPASHRLV
jgi:hypothetical protein